MERKYSNTELGMGYGLVLGGAAGIMLLVFTGSAVWLGIASALGLVGGMIWGQLSDEPSDTDPPPAPETSHDPDGHAEGR